MAIIRKPRILLLAGAVTFVWVLYFLVDIQSYDTPLQRLPFFKPSTSPLPPSLTAENDTLVTGGPRILLVSAIYPIAKVKYPQYDEYLPQYLGSVTADLHIFTTPELEAHVRSLIRAVPSRRLTVNTTFLTPVKTPALSRYAVAYVSWKKKKIPPKFPPEVHAYSNSRPYFLDQAVKVAAAEGIEYDYAFWNEASSIHQEGHLYSQWPSPQRVDEVWKEAEKLEGLGGVSKDELIFFPMTEAPPRAMKHWSEGMRPPDTKFTQGTFFGGSPKAIDWFTRVFYAYHDYYMLINKFIGKEQALINSLVFLFPRNFITVWYNDPIAPVRLSLLNGTSPATPIPRRPDQSSLGRCSSAFFYYQFFLSNPSAQDAMRKLWIEGPHPKLSFLWNWATGKDETPCQVTRVLSMLDVLRRQFGDDWEVGKTLTIPDRLWWDAV